MRMSLLSGMLLMLSTAAAADPQMLRRAGDLPPFSYAYAGSLESLVQSDTLFAPLAATVADNIHRALAGFRIDDLGMQRALLSALSEIDFMRGRYGAALEDAEAARGLEEKPIDRMLSGLLMRAMVHAVGAGTAPDTPAYLQAVAVNLAGELATLPFEQIESAIRAAKKDAQLLSEALTLGHVRELLQPVADRAGGLTAEVASGVIEARFALGVLIPLKRVLVAAYGGYLATHQSEPGDAWSAHTVVLDPGEHAHPVAIGIWDTGVDPALFHGRLLLDEDQPATVSFDRYGEPTSGALAPIPPSMQALVPKLLQRLRGFSDLQSDVDSREAAEVEQYLSGLGKDDYRQVVEQMALVGNYVHGTHVAGIAVAGNPFARLVNARMEFGYALNPDPCPSERLAALKAAETAQYVSFMRRRGVRVVNMSWAITLAHDENDVERCGLGATPLERQALAKHYFVVASNALARAIADAPGMLFVAAAGNTNQDTRFAGAVPASFNLPNLLVVGAVDHAGEEADFTAYGPTVLVDADGYQIDGPVPGGGQIALSGTSMAAPQVTNVAGKVLAIDPGLSPEEVIRVILDTADASADGRRALVDPAKAVAAAMARAS